MAEIADASASRVAYERATLQCLGEALDFDVAFFVRDDAIGDTQQGLHDDVVERTRRHFAGYGRELAPVLEAACERGVAVDREVMGTRLERTRLYREFMGPHGGHSTLLVPLTFRHAMLGVLALGRRTRGFRAAELRWLRELSPVLRLCEASWGQPQAPFPLTPDACVASFLAVIQYAPFDTSLKRALAELPSLLAYCHRMRALCFEPEERASPPGAQEPAAAPGSAGA